VQACSQDGWNARVAAVVSNKPEAAGLVFAQTQGIPTAVVNHRGYPDRDSFDAELAKTVTSFAPDVVVLAGFMRILTPVFITPFAGRMLNIHPSLLPAFTGLHTHQRALDAGCKVTGATVHFVTPELDHGPIVAQAVVPVLAGDTEETLSARVLKQEHRMYPQALRWFIDGDLSVDADGIVRQLKGQSQLFGL